MKLLRVGICLLVAFSVLAFGAVEVWSESILEVGAAALLLWWAVFIFYHPKMEIRWSHLFWPLSSFLAIGTLQLVLGETAYTFFTRVALLKITGCSVLFFLSVQAFRNLRDLRTLAWFLMIFAFAVSLFGIIQNFTSNGKLYWIRPISQGVEPMGPYVNRNDFAGLMELLAPVGLSLLLFRGVRREQRPLVGLLTILPIAALVLSGSRGGMVGFLFEIGLLGLILRHKHMPKARAFAAVGAVLIALVAMGWIGADKAAARLTHYRSEALSLQARFTMVRTTWRVFLDHPLVGSGLGTLVVVYPQHATYYDRKIVDHTHNDYVELLAETGLAGALCGLAFVYLLFREAGRDVSAEQSLFSLGIRSAALAACAGMLVHSLVDFNLHIPANGLIFLLQVSLLISPILPKTSPGPFSQQRAVT